MRAKELEMRIPKRTNTVENPPMNTRVRRINRFLCPFPSCISFKDVPLRKERNEGIKGNTHGDAKLTIPAKKVTSIFVIPPINLQSPVSAQFPSKASIRS
jgi:hypothetical protein